MKCVKWYEWRVSAACVCVLGLLLSCTAGAWAQEEAQGVPPRAERVVFLPAHRLASMIRSGEISSTEALEAYLAQIHRHNGALNAIVTLDEEGARKRAREADEALSRGIVWGPLHGVPVTVKDNYATKGMRTTSSHPPLAGFVPGFDATAVARVREAGAIIIGKTNNCPRYGPADQEPGLRSDQQPLGPRTNARGQHRWRRRRGGCRHVGPVPRQRHRRLDPAALTFLRHLRAQAHREPGPVIRPDAGPGRRQGGRGAHRAAPGKLRPPGALGG